MANLNFIGGYLAGPRWARKFAPPNIAELSNFKITYNEVVLVID